MELQDTLRMVLSEIGQCTGGIGEEEVRVVLEEILSAKRIFVAGVGRSGFACRGFAMRLMHAGLSAYMVGDVSTPSFGKDDLLLIGSGSGSTDSLLCMAKKVKQIGGRLILITINDQSPIAKLSDQTIRLRASSQKAEKQADSVKTIQPMGSLFEQSLQILLDSIIIMLMKKANILEDDMFDRHANLE